MIRNVISEFKLMHLAILFISFQSTNFKKFGLIVFSQFFFIKNNYYRNPLQDL